MKDEYKTRTDEKYSISNRLDRIYFNKPETLSYNEINFYEENGYVLLKNFYDENIMKKIKYECDEVFNGNRDYYINIEPKINKVRSVLKIHDKPEFKKLLSIDLMNLSKSILGSETYIHQSRINYKYGNKANGWNWHSDFETWHSKDGMPKMRCFSAMICVDDNTVDNGCLNVIPKSHKKFISCPKVGNLKPEDEFSEQKEGVPNKRILSFLIKDLNSKIVPIKCNSGDLILFDCNLLHYSDKNITNKKRTNIYFVFNSVNNKLRNPYNGCNHRPEEMGSLI